LGENAKSVPEIVENNYNPIILKMKELVNPLLLQLMALLLVRGKYCIGL
jgi:hypothetical protein